MKFFEEKEINYALTLQNMCNDLHGSHSTGTGDAIYIKDENSSNHPIIFKQCNDIDLTDIHHQICLMEPLATNHDDDNNGENTNLNGGTKGIEETDFTTGQVSPNIQQGNLTPVQFEVLKTLLQCTSTQKRFSYTVQGEL